MARIDGSQPFRNIIGTEESSQVSKNKGSGKSFERRTDSIAQRFFNFIKNALGINGQVTLPPEKVAKAMEVKVGDLSKRETTVTGEKDQGFEARVIEDHFTAKDERGELSDLNKEKEAALKKGSQSIHEKASFYPKAEGTRHFKAAEHNFDAVQILLKMCDKAKPAERAEILREIKIICKRALYQYEESKSQFRQTIDFRNRASVSSFNAQTRTIDEKMGVLKEVSKGAIRETQFLDRLDQKEVRGKETTDRKEIALERRTDIERLERQFLTGKEALEKKAPSSTTYRIERQDLSRIDRVSSRVKQPVTVIDRDAGRKAALEKKFGPELAKLRAEKEARRS